mgnify:CR=1 FL=1
MKFNCSIIRVLRYNQFDEVFLYLFNLQLIQQEQQNRREAERAMREDIDRKFLTLKHATEELNLDIKEQLKVDIIAGIIKLNVLHYL